MALSIATGWNVAAPSLDPLSDYFGHEPRYTRVARGGERARVLSGRSRLDGERTCTVSIAGLTYAALDAYVTAVFGDWTSTTSVKVTLLAEDVGGDETRWNAWADLPLIGEDYTEEWSDQIRDLTMTFVIDGPAS